MTYRMAARPAGMESDRAPSRFLSPQASSRFPGTAAGSLPSEQDELISITTYLADERTRIFDYNGRKLPTYMGMETFGGARVARLPTKVIEFAMRQPVISALLPCRLGYFPHARGHEISRPQGYWSHTLLFCADGEGWVENGDGRWRMTRGSAVLLQPFEPHSYKSESKRPWSLYWVHFNGRMAQEYHDMLSVRGWRSIMSIPSDVRLIQYFEQILNIYHEGHAYHLLVQASGRLHQLLGTIRSLADQSRKPPDQVETRIKHAIEVMKANPGSNMTIQEFAAAANMSPMYFAVKFREHTKQSPRSFFTKVKIDTASKLLATTSMKIDAIAREVGYNDAFYFSRVFKRTVGQTPSGYREAHRAG